MKNGVIDASRAVRTYGERSATPVARERVVANRRIIRTDEQWWPLVLAAVIALSSVFVLQRFEPDAGHGQSGDIASSAAATPTLDVFGMSLTAADGVATITTDSGLTVGLTTTGIGDGDLGTPASERRDDAIVTSWGSVDEWYRPLESGFEHGYTIGAPVSGDELIVEVAVVGATVGALDSTTLTFDTLDRGRLWYRDLYVFDASGRDLPATLSPTDDGEAFTVNVDVAGAEYPITIDPTITEDQVLREVTTSPTGQTATVGGAGGPDDETVRCDPFAAVTGMTGISEGANFGDANDYLESVQLRCTPLQLAGGDVTLDAASSYDSGSYNAPGGGFSSTQTCPPGEVVTGFQGYDGLFVDQIQLFCAPLGTDGTVGAATLVSSPDAVIGGDTTLTPFGPEFCSNGFVDGVTGRTGDVIDSIALTCVGVGGSNVDIDGGALGRAVAIDGDRMAVAAPDATTDAVIGGSGTPARGVVFMYERTGPDAPWTSDGVVTNPSPSYREFASAIALTGTRLAVGAPSESLGPIADQGRVVIYDRIGPGDWAQSADIGAPGGSDVSYRFGFSLDYAGPDLLAIGAPGWTDSPPELGTGQVFTFDGTTVTEVNPLLMPTAGVGAELGYSVAVDDLPGGGHRLVAGAPGDDFDAGARYTLDDDGGGFANVDGGSGGVGARLGTSVAVSGDRVAYTNSTNNANVTATPDGGSTWTTELIASIERGTYSPPSNVQLALEGGTFAVGVPDDNRVEVFRYDGVDWGGAQVLGGGVDQFRPTGATGDDRAGWTVALDGGTLVAGAPGDDGVGDLLADSGAVYAIEIPVVATFTGAVNNQWIEPGNWDVGVVPGGDDTAIVPASDLSPVVVSGGTSQIGRLISSVDIEIQSGGVLQIVGPDDAAGDGPSEIRSGTVAATPGGRLVVTSGVLEIAEFGELHTLPDAGDPGLVEVDGDVTFDGPGMVTNDGLIEQTGFTRVFEIGPELEWNTGPLGELSASTGLVDVQSNRFDASQGTLAVGAGARLLFSTVTPVLMTASTVLETEIIGPSTSLANYGRFQFGGTLQPSGTLRANFTVPPGPTDTYAVVTCGDCLASPPEEDGGSFDVAEFLPSSPQTEALDLVDRSNSFTITTIPNKTVSDTPGGDGFGEQIDIDGDWAAVSSANDDGLPGVVSILQRDPLTGLWDIVQEISDPDPPLDVGFGADVAIEGNRLVVITEEPSFLINSFVRAAPGAPFVDDGVVGVGAPTSFIGDIDIHDGVLVVTNDDVNGALVWDLDQTSPVFSRFGSAEIVGTEEQSVTLGGDFDLGTGYAVVGQKGSDAVHVFEQSGLSPNPTFGNVAIQTLSGAAGSAFGHAVASSAGWLVVSAPLDNTDGGDAGSAFVYPQLPDGTFGAGQRLSASDAGNSNVFGSDVAIDGDTVVVGAATGSLAGNPYRDGAAYSFGRVGSAWSETAVFRATDGWDDARLGHAVAVSNDNVLVGAVSDSNRNGLLAGSVYSFTAIAADDNPTFAVFEFEVIGSPAVSVSGSGIEASSLSRDLVDGSDPGDGSVASTSLGAIDVDDPIGTDLDSTPIASITLGESVLAAITGPSPLDRIALTDIELRYQIGSATPPEFGGWEDLLAEIAAARPTDVEAQALPLRPLQNILFGEVADYPEVEALRLDQLSLAGTPIASIPIASIALGATPIASIEFDSLVVNGTVVTDWCAAIDAAGSSLSCGAGADIDPSTTTLVGLAVEGVPIASIPIASIPIASIDLEASPIASIPIASIDVTGTPIASIPIASIPIASIPIASIPIASIPIASIPIASIPIASIPIASIPIASIDLAGTPIASIAPAGSPIASIPIASIPIASIAPAGSPIASIPIASIPIASIPIASIPIVGSPIASIDVNGTPIASIPIASIAVEGSPIASIPIASIPIASIAAQGSPIASIPIASIPIASIPIASIPIASIAPAGTPIASIPIASIDVTGTPIASIPIASIPIADRSALVDCSAVDCDRATLGAAYAAGAILPGAQFGAVASQLDGVRWSEILPVLGISEADFQSALVDANGDLLLFSDIADFDDLTLGELPDSVLRLLSFGELSPYLSGIRWSDVLPLLGISEEQFYTALGDELLFAEIENFDDLTLGELPDEVLSALTLGVVGPYLSGVRWSDVLPLLQLSEDDFLGALVDANGAPLLLGSVDNFDDLTLGEIIELLDTTIGDFFAALIEAAPELLADITLGDLLTALVAPSDYPWETVEFAEVETSDLPGAIGTVSFGSDFQITDTNRTQQVELSLQVPPTTGYVAGSSTLSSGSPTVVTPIPDPVRDGDRLVWTVRAAPLEDYTLGYDLQPTLNLGQEELVAEARIVGVAGTLTATQSVTVQQAFEPNDTPGEASPIVPDSLYLTHITPDDVDYFKIAVDEGERLVVNLSNMDADFDVVIYGRSESASITPLVPSSGQTAGAPATEPDVNADGSVDSVPDADNDTELAAGLPVVATGARRGVTPETVVTPPLSGGEVFIEVYGANGASSVQPLVLQATVTEGSAAPACPAVQLPSQGTPGAPSVVPADANALILVNQERLSALYPNTYQAAIGAVDDLVTYLTGPGVGLGVVPGVVQVDGIAGIAADYGAWDAVPCDPDNANAVVQTVADEITALRATRDIDHIMIVGGDDVIPMARVVDGARISNEFDYRNAFGGNNALAGAAWASQFLTDEPYGETDALAFGDRFLYVTDTALGRLVEDPSEISAQLAAFVGAGGVLEPETGLVVGYDFLDDGSEAIAADMAAAGLVVDDEFGTSNDDDSWTADDLTGKLFPTAGETPDLISLNAHFDHRRALPAFGNTNGDESDLFLAQTVLDAAPSDLLGKIVFSMGCHSGLSVSSNLLPGDTVLENDFPQAFSGVGGIYVGNTGYGYGDTDIVAYSERLMELFGESLLAPTLLAPGDPITTAGQALQFAKNDYLAELGQVSAYDEKALMEATFYGVPFYQIGTVAPVGPDPVPTNEPQNGVLVVNGVTPLNELDDSSSDGVKFVNRDDSGDPLETKVPFKPAQPIVTIDVTDVDPTDSAALEQVAHGAMIIDMQSTYQEVNPVIVKPVVDAESAQPEPVIADVRFPSVPTNIRTTEQPEGTRQSVTLATGQFRGGSDLGVQRLDDQIDLLVFYAAADEDDFVPPTITDVQGVITNGRLSISATITDVGGATGAGSGVDRVNALVAQSPGSGTVDWNTVTLSRATSTGNLWVGGLTLAAGVEHTEFFVQAKDGAGNVGVANNKVGNYTGVQSVPVQADFTVVVDQGSSSGSDGVYGGPVTVSVDGNAGIGTFVYSVNGGEAETLPAAGVTISGEGPNVVDVSNGATTATVSITIDTTPPTISIVTPAAGSAVPAGPSLFATFTCADASATMCTGSVDGGDPIASGDSLASFELGEYTLTVTGIDSLGNSSSASSAFTVIQTEPEIVSVSGPLTPQAIDDGISFEIEFTDLNYDIDDYSVTIDWGTGDPASVCTAGEQLAVTGNPSCAVAAEPTIGAVGLAVGSYVYDAPGIYTVSVTIDDGQGNSDSATYQFAVVYDPLEPSDGSVTGAGHYWSGPNAYIESTDGSSAHFGYNARYRSNHPDVPVGQTKLRLVDEFEFESVAYDYLVVNDAMAVAAGVGMLNEVPGYRFWVRGTDNGDVDFYQITIEDPEGRVIYDNGVLFETDALGDVLLRGGIRIKP